MTKRELIKYLLSLDNSLAEDSLKGKTNKELEKMISFAKHNSENEENKNEETIFFESDTSDVYEERQSESTESFDEDDDGGSIMNRLNSYQAERSKKPTIDRNELITVMNITSGILIYRSRKSGMHLRFERYGDIEQIEFGELLTMRSSSRKFLDEPWILILDEEAVRYLGLEPLYKKLVHPDDIDRIFKLPIDKFEEVVNNAPRGVAQLIIKRAKTKIEQKKLDSMAKINILQEKYNIDLTS